MSLILSGLQLAGSIFRTSLTTRVIPARLICSSFVRYNEEESEESRNDDENKVNIDPAKDRTRVIPYETSVRYIRSKAYQQTYGNDPVWKLYRRNHKGMFAPRKTRKTCIRNRIVTAGNPCPLCRDEYLVIDYRNTDLLKQFISDQNGAIISYQKTGVCQRKHNHLLVAILKAKDHGTIAFDVPLKRYNYSEWKSPEDKLRNVAKMSGGEICCTFAILGGGIAGVSCAESIGFLAPQEDIILITASPLIKAVTNVVPLGKSLMQFDVEEKDMSTLMERNDSLRIIHDTAINIDTANKQVKTENGRIIKYKTLCLCNGARPKLILESNDFVIGIRDTESVLQFSQKIKNARRIVVVGNGGIATEIIHEVDGVEMFWVIKDKHISATFVDPGAAEFFSDKVYRKTTSTEVSVNAPTKRMRYKMSDNEIVKDGPALGPDWHNNFDITGTFMKSAKVHVEYECEIAKILGASEQKEFDPEGEWPVYVELTNGKTIGCDLIVSATGVIPNSNVPGLEGIKKGEDGGLLVDWKLETSEKDIYAAGDVCTSGWKLPKHWFQMRLWTQAHQMGRYAAKSMVCNLNGEDFLQDFCFELFTHVTKFFGYKVILLGLYNGQKLSNNYEILLRMTKGQEYVKIVLEDGKMQGAVLIGDTDLEEMCENLILDQLDLSIYGEDLLNPDIDIEDYFD